jgi:recombination DNA repair RAD52 pathway protein
MLLNVMQRRLDVLLSPEVVEARNWADSFYTEKGQRDLLKKHELNDPMAMIPSQITEALAQFAADRQSLANANAAFAKSQAATVAGANKYQQSQQAAAAAAAAAPRQRATFGAAYAPKRSDRPQRYQAPYNPVRYSIGPWGGVWIGH